MPVSAMSERRRRHVGALVVAALALATAFSQYTVKHGDTLSGIASAHGVTTADLVEANTIADPDRIFVGQVLSIPGTSDAAAVGSHMVEPGDSLATIAARYGTTVEELAKANGITNPDLIFVGTRLLLEAGDQATPSTTSTAVHVVSAGETLGAIAQQYGMSARELAEINELSNPDLIFAGQELAVSGVAFRCPVPNAAFFNDWGFPRSGDRFHEGNDLFAPRGTPVLAPVSGFVHQIVGSIGGIQFRLDGDDGHRYIGTHMEEFGAAGQVRAGDVIGFVGDSGNAVGSSPHLHFEIHLDRTAPVNPYPTLEAACS